MSEQGPSAASPHAVDPRDEKPHPRSDDELWNESWYFDFVDADASLGGYVRVGLVPNLGGVWYWACLVGAGRPLVMVVDHDVPLPGSPSSLELRHEGLWADHNCEEPLERWSLGLEAFAITLDDPADAYHGARGDRVPFGFDLEWETDGEPFNYPAGVDRYEVPCRVHGEVLVGSERIELDGVGQRDHSWRPRDWWSTGWCWTAFQLDDRSAWHGVTLRPDIGWSIGYRQTRDGAPLEVAGDLAVAETLGPEGIPTGARLELLGEELTFTPTAWAPVLLTSPDGRESRFPRGMGRFEASDGRSGVGWIEFNQPS